MRNNRAACLLAAASDAAASDAASSGGDSGAAPTAALPRLSVADAEAMREMPSQEFAALVFPCCLSIVVRHTLSQAGHRHTTEQQGLEANKIPDRGGGGSQRGSKFKEIRGIHSHSPIV